MNECVCVCVPLSFDANRKQSFFCQRCWAAHASRQAYPEEGIERSVLHEFGDDEDGAASRQDALQTDHVGVVELTHDGGLGEEVPPLTLCVAGFQRLDRHHHLPAPGLLETPAAHLAKFTWSEENEVARGGVGGDGGGQGLSEQRNEQGGGVAGKRASGRVRGEEALLVGLGSELRVDFDCGRELEKRRRGSLVGSGVEDVGERGSDWYRSSVQPGRGAGRQRVGEVLEGFAFGA